MRRASALLMALWTIAVLSIMVLSFASEAHMHSGVNVYVRDRNRVSRLIDAGKVLAEVVISDFKNAKEWSDGENREELLEEDRWVFEKRDLKTSSKCRIGPILVDDRVDDDGNLLNPSTVTVDIQLVNAGKENAINVNELYSSDKNYRLRWELLLTNVCKIPEDFEVRATDSHYKGDAEVRLIELLICSWNDWRDDDDVATAGEEGEECGAEKEWYEEYYESEKVDKEDRKYPRNGAIPDIGELAQVRGFRDYPVVLTGGVLNPDEKNKELQVTVTGIYNLLGTTGNAKVNVNDCTVEQLLTVPGVGAEDEDDVEEAQARAEAIVATLKVPPTDYYDVDTENRDWWPYKDWNDLLQRVGDNPDPRFGDIEIRSEANEYFIYEPDDTSVFKVTITCELNGKVKKALGECYYNSSDKKIRYIRWREE